MTGLAGLFLLILVLGAQGYKDATWARNKRQAVQPNMPVPVPEKNNEVKNKKYQACMAPGNRAGHCQHLSTCKDASVRKHPNVMDYMCIIEKEFVGICCPDDAVESSNPVPVRGLAGSLPAVATEGDDAIVLPDSNPSERGARASRGCGVSTVRDMHRVTGGRPTSSQEWPWVAALLDTSKTGKEPEQYCGGVLITDRHVLTAAHCVHRKKPYEINVRLGEYDLRSPNETRALDFKVTEIRIHKRYVSTTYKNDIAILKIHRPTIFNTYIWPVCLPPVNAVFENKEATVIGWGTTTYGGAGSYVLMEVTVPIWSQSKCASKFTQEITSNHVCAGLEEGKADACQGDSGGPLMTQLSNGRWVSVGIVSWGIGCGDPGRPGVYTRVNAYLDWIFANTIF